MADKQSGGADVKVHRHVASAMPVNAYLAETPGGVVAVDSTLTVSDARGLRERAEELGKPLRAVLITHAHPDHYGGAVELVGDEEIPIVAAEGVDAVIRRDDEIKEQIIRPMFGEEWPRVRRFPNHTMSDRESISFDGVSFTLLDLGPGESPHDSVWLVGDDRLVAFAGDTAYEHMHCFLADGYWESWLANIARLRAELAPDAQFHFGHGDPTAALPFDWQEEYINVFVEAVQAADWSDPATANAGVRPPDDQVPALERASVPDGTEHRTGGGEARLGPRCRLTESWMAPLLGRWTLREQGVPRRFTRVLVKRCYRAKTLFLTTNECRRGASSGLRARPAPGRRGRHGWVITYRRASYELGTRSMARASRCS
jgi:glyoxylase-like metal-dependent hydrolase (beta-lactamase superfamily II)